ncbi:MAG: hypothetical protein IJ488_02955 [Clostridia bacterium]|nr:hypothetical protein [Clostridia bacterium]
MSEEEKKKRSEYKRWRTRAITVISAVLASLILVTAVMALIYRRLDETYYIEYYESGSTSYSVSLFDNDFYEDDTLEGGNAYVTSLVDKLALNFRYNLLTAAEGVTYDYSYKVFSKVKILDRTSGKLLYEKASDIIPDTGKLTSNEKSLMLSPGITVDYAACNELATRFIETYSGTGTLEVTMQVSVTGSGKGFDSTGTGVYYLTLTAPLGTETVSFTTTSTPPDGTRILASSSFEGKEIFLILALVFGALAILGAIVLTIFVYKTRNKDINYRIKVQKLVSAYKSFIQKITSEVDLSSYSPIYVEGFSDLLEIRDTLQSPILMFENGDQTKTTFYIPTQTSLIYVYEIKVENYDLIYAATAAAAEASEVLTEASVIFDAAEYTDKEAAPVCEVACTEAAKEEQPEADAAVEEISVGEDTPAEEEPAVDAEPTAEAAKEAVSDASPENTDGTADFMSGIKYDYSFEAKLSLADDETKDFYASIATFVKARGVKIQRSWKKERVYLGRNLFATLIFKGARLAVALALDPKEYEGSKYKFTDLSGVKRFAETPMLIKITSKRRVKYVYELLTVMFENAGVPETAKEVKLDKIPALGRRALINRGLIKVTDRTKSKKS